MGKIALITGISGQDGSYLAELLLSKGYEVHGIIRRTSISNMARICHIENELHLHYGDLTDGEQISSIIYNVDPDEVYNLGAQSQVRVSFEMPEQTGNVTGLGATRMLECIRRSGKKIKFYQASSSEMFGNASISPQNEETPFSPRSPYAVAKLYAYWMTRNYREEYGMFAVNGILFNHESPRRGEQFVTRKISLGISAILSGKAKDLRLGNLNAARDWGYAPEYVEAMWRMMQKWQPDDYVIGTGETHTVQEFLEFAFEHVGLDWKKYVKQDSRYMRPGEVNVLRADASKAREELAWKPKTKFRELVELMVDADVFHD